MTVSRKVPTLVSILLVSCLPCFAGEMFGKVFDGGGAVGEAAASVAVQCGEQTTPPAKTDKSGSYHLVVKGTGKCTLTVEYKGQSAELGVASYDEPVQYDLVLETKDGKLAVRRK